MTSIDSFLKSWYVLLDLVKDRGYEISDKYNKLMDKDLMHLIRDGCLNIIGTNKEGDTIYIEFVNGNKIKLSILQEKIKKIKEAKENVTVVFVIKAKKNSGIKKLETKEKYNIQIFESKYLQINPTKHSLVPNHIKQSAEEIMLIRKNYRILCNSQLPLLLQTDPISRYYNFKKGDVIKITNKREYNYEQLFNGSGKNLSPKELILEKKMIADGFNKKKSNIDRRKELKKYFTENLINNILRYRFVK